MHSIDQAVIPVSKRTFISDGTNHNYIDSIKVEAIDSTGAGNSFVGTVLFEFSKLDNI